MRNFLLLFIFTVASGQTPEYDILIRNGRMVDGTGKIAYPADLGIKGDKIIRIGDLSKKTAIRMINAQGLVVAPGFIDMLGQSEMNVLINSSAESKITQGVTTEITCEGGSVAPLTDQMQQEDQKDYNYYNLKIDWKTFPEFMNRFEKQGVAINMGLFVGATTIRRYFLGNDDQQPTSEVLEKMKNLVAESMQQGALGLSSSLMYTPALFAKTNELIELAKVASRYGGIYISHIRNESNHIDEALSEAIEIGEKAKIPVEIYHLKVSGKHNWNKMAKILTRIEGARAKGLDMTADQYPYTAAATGLTACLPAWMREGGNQKMFGRLRDPKHREEAKKYILTEKTTWDNMYFNADGGKGILIASVQNLDLKKFEGKSIAEVTREWRKIPPASGTEELDTIMDFVLADTARTGCIYFVMSEENVKMVLAKPWVSVGSDAGAGATTGILSQEKTHPRAWGSFPRILGKYVREENVLTLEAAINKMTSLPAGRVKLEKRGELKEGYFADITIFDPEKVKDVSTYENPNQRSVGVRFVLVNGKIVLDQGEITSERPGKVLRGPGYKKN